LIEAMAVGTIPITNYGHWLTPPLIDGENCLAFDTLQDLDTVLGKAHSLSEAEVVEMRVRVLEYYDKHLSPEKLVERIQSCSAQTIWLHTLDGA
jgi:hypothetical protein